MLAHYSDDMTRWIKAIENATFARQRAAYDRVAAENARLRKLLSLGTGTIPGSPDMPDSPDLVRHSFRIPCHSDMRHAMCTGIDRIRRHRHGTQRQLLFPKHPQQNARSLSSSRRPARPQQAAVRCFFVVFVPFPSFFRQN